MKITETRLNNDRNLALSTAMEDILRINGRIIIEGRWNRESYESSARFLESVKEGIYNVLDKKIEEMKAIAERMVQA